MHAIETGQNHMGVQDPSLSLYVGERIDMEMSTQGNYLRSHHFGFNALNKRKRLMFNIAHLDMD
jgi:hypothetical protein